MEDSDAQEYKAQLAEIDAQLAVCSDLQTRNELMDMRNDLQELISLVSEEAEEGGDVQQAGTSRDEEEDALLTEEEVIGMHCRAPYSRKVDRAVQLHDAVIFDILSKGSDPSTFKVLVLYCYPLEDRMRPCEFFLDDRCTYGDSCRFSHGEEVLFSDLLEYISPEFSSLTEGKLVLVRDDRKLWSSARVVAIDGDNVAAQLLSSGKEIGCTSGEVIPLNDDFVEEDAEKPENAFVASWPELKGETHGQLKVGDIGDWERHTRGIGMKLMMKMGYRVGEGLGRDSHGIVHAIQPVVYPKNKSVDVCMERKKQLADGVALKKKRVKKEMANRLQQAQPQMDIFDVINQKLATNVPSEAELREKEKKHLKESSSKKLGIHAVNLDKEMKDLKAQERKLREGITRNQRDRATAELLKKKLAACQDEIHKLEMRQERLSKELSGRHKKRELF